MTTPDTAERGSGIDTAPRIAKSARVPGYRAAHQRVQAGRGHASSYRCEGACGRQADEWSYDWDDPGELVALVNGRPRWYSLSADHYRSLCFRCHRKFDAEQRTLRIFASW